MGGLTVFFLFVVLAIVGAPVFVALGLAGLIGTVFILDIPGTVMPQGFFSSIDSWPLLCTPFFVLSGNIMGKCGPATALFDFCDKLLGHIRGGLPVAVVLSCIFFGTVTGSGIATAVAIGSMAIPEMLRLGFKKDFVFGLVAVSATLGLMIPPSIYMILFAGLTNGSIVEFFTAGYVPGLIIAAFLMLIAVLKSPPNKKERSPWSERIPAMKKALPALGMPVFIMGSIYTGVFTPTEAAALSVLYTVIICPFFYRSKFSMNALLEATKAACVTTAQIYIILGAVAAFSSAFTYMHIPQGISQYVTELGFSAVQILFAMVFVYLIFGMFLDVIPILYLTVPVFFPVVVAMNIDLLHFMIVTITMTMAAQCTPPFGVILFALSGAFKTNVGVIIKGSLPFVLILLLCEVLFILDSRISTFFVEFFLR